MGASDASDTFVPGDLLEAPTLISLLPTSTSNKYQGERWGKRKGPEPPWWTRKWAWQRLLVIVCAGNKLCKEDYKNNNVFSRISHSLRLDSNFQGFEKKSMIATSLSICSSFSTVPSGRIMSQLSLQKQFVLKNLSIPTIAVVLIVKGIGSFLFFLNCRFF